MKKLQYLLTLTALMTMLVSSGHAQDCCDSSPAYSDCGRACYMSAIVPIAALLVIGALVLITDSHHHHHSSSSHTHSHSGFTSGTTTTTTSS